MFEIAKTTSDLILGVIRKEFWILDHFNIFVIIVLNGAMLCRINMIVGGLRYPSAFLVISAMLARPVLSALPKFFAWSCYFIPSIWRWHDT